VPAVDWHCIRYALVESIERAGSTYWIRQSYCIFPGATFDEA